MRTLTQVSTDVFNNVDRPAKLKNLYMELGAMYGYYADKMKPIKSQKADAWVKIKQSGVDGKLLSDRYTDKLWATTEAGKIEIDLTWQLKGIDKLTDAIKQASYINQQEGKNQA